MMRDIPRFVRLIEKGQARREVDDHELTVNEIRQAWQDCGERAIIAGWCYLRRG
jgi:hypothetical protein